MPIAELKRGIDLWIWPMVFGDKSLSPLVERACHALSLDDERTTFHPLLWDEEAEAEMIAKGASDTATPPVKPGRLTQIWFAGVHSNIGGGYPEDQLSLVPLEWMMHEAKESGLDLDADAIKEVSESKSPYARLYDSRAGAGAFYRYEPRRTLDIADDAGTKILPIIDSSVIVRMAFGSDHYAPITLPHLFWVMAPDGKLVPVHGPGATLRLDNTKRTVVSPAFANQKNAAQTAADTKLLASAISLLGHSDYDAIRLVWDTVWWRRIFYFLTMALATILATYPWLGGQYGNAVSMALSSLPVVGQHLASSYDQRLGHADQSAGGLVASVVDAAGGLIPSYLSSWTRALVDSPAEFGAMAIGILLCLATSRTLRELIRDRAHLAWNGALRNQYLVWSYDRDKGALRVTALLFVVACCALLVALFAWWGEPSASARSTSVLIETGFITFLFGLLVRLRTVSLRKLKQTMSMPVSSGQGLLASGALRFARLVRDNEDLVKLGTWITWGAIPALFAGAVVAAGVAIGNRVAFDVANSTGAICQASVRDGDLEHERIGRAAKPFATDQTCWPSGLVLLGGHRYRITLDASSSDWFDKTVRTDPAGFATDGFRHFSASPLRRWWRENWFQPVARIDTLGNDEYVLTPTEPFEPNSKADVAYKTCQTNISTGKEPNFAKISDAEADELMRCAPVPEDRKKLVALITTKTSGELFIYVNDAVLAWPGMTDLFYRNNRGTALVTVERADP
jgi:hypothetical protein